MAQLHKMIWAALAVVAGAAAFQQLTAEQDRQRIRRYIRISTGHNWRIVIGASEHRLEEYAGAQYRIGRNG